MSVKVSLKESVFNVKYFPKLMIGGGGVIVLFSSNSEGVVVSDTGYESIGHYSIGWNMEAFQDYDGEVTLKNE